MTHISSIRSYTIIWAWLMALLLLTVIAAALVHIEPWGIVIAMTITVIKALLVILYFMHVRFSPRLVWVFAGASFLWLGILLTLTFSDYLTRGSDPNVRILAPELLPRYQASP